MNKNNIKENIMIRHLLSVLILSVFLISCSQSPLLTPVNIPEMDGAEDIGSETCIECHDDFDSDRYNVHSRIKQFESRYVIGCESCHGPGSLHAEMECPSAIIGFGDDGVDGETAAAVCLKCHADGNQMGWMGSEHPLNGVYCLDCHKIHNNTREALLIKPELDLCLFCHNEQRARLHYKSHHPLAEGKMTCNSCHEPHGSLNGEVGMLKTDERANDLCLNCHARYQGPFIFEHAPVAENCLECHDPHGTVANNLLTQNEPFLCLQCHEGHFHANREAKAVNVPAKPGTIDTYTGETHSITGRNINDWSRGFLTKCTSCHQAVHGSDLPSQTIAGHGAGLTR